MYFIINIKKHHHPHHHHPYHHHHIQKRLFLFCSLILFLQLIIININNNGAFAIAYGNDNDNDNDNDTDTVTKKDMKKKKKKEMKQCIKSCKKIANNLKIQNDHKRTKSMKNDLTACLNSCSIDISSSTTNTTPSSIGNKCYDTGETMNVESPIYSNWNLDSDSYVGATQNTFLSSQQFPTLGCPWGLIFFGISMSRNHYPDVKTSNPFSITHQTKFDFNEIQDRGGEYYTKYLDEGWLSGGGEGVASFNLPNIDSTHMEIAHLSTVCLQSNLVHNPLNENKCGISLYDIYERMKTILFDPIPLMPTTLSYTGNNELQARFQPDDNEALYCLYLQILKKFRDVMVLDYTDPFHASIVRNLVGFGGTEKFWDFIEERVTNVINVWRSFYPQGTIVNDDIPHYQEVGTGGIYLFWTRNRPLLYFNGKGETYFVQWFQNGIEIAFANPYPTTGTSNNFEEIEENLILLTDENVNQYLDPFQEYCNDFVF